LVNVHNSIGFFANRGSNGKKLKSVLVHVCCAHCAAYTITYWWQQGYEVSTLWYNPNIHPYLEHQQRLEAMQSIAQIIQSPLLITEKYDIANYFRQVTGHDTHRCQYCFRIRLLKTAETAQELSFNAFTTTLLISPQQKHELLLETGKQLSKDKGIEFLYVDLRTHYSDSCHITKPFNLYRQQYCGCVYSKRERYSNRKIE
ncbi:epoxyqueuosine reductase QueH, partial [Chloroflexota bacterium]